MIYDATTIELRCGEETPEAAVRPLSAILRSRIIEAAILFTEEYRSQLPQGVAIVFDGRPRLALVDRSESCLRPLTDAEHAGLEYAADAAGDQP